MMENIDINAATEQEQSSYIKIIGVGGAGTNAVNHMFNNKITGVDFIVCNTDRQSLDKSPVQTKIQLGKGLGAGNNPAVAKKAAEAAEDQIKEALSGNTHMLFIAAGMGGGTGTGASPVIARIAKEIEVAGDINDDEEKDEILVVGIVTTPLAFEGRNRREQAIAGIEELKKYVDAMIVVNTDKLKERGKMNMRASFALADDVLLTAAKGVSEMMTAEDSYIHVDFKDVQSVMRHSGVALMGNGVGEGEDRAYKAVQAAATCDLLNNNDLSKTDNVLMYISCSSEPEYEINNEEIEIITDHIQEITNRDVNIIWGYGYDDSLEGKIAVTLVATGFEFKEMYNPTQRENRVEIKNPFNKTTSSKTIEIETPKVENTIETLEEKKKAEEGKLTDFVVRKENIEDRTVDTVQAEATEKRIVGVLRTDCVEEVSEAKHEEEAKSFISSVAPLSREEAFAALDARKKVEEETTVKLSPEMETEDKVVVDTITDEEPFPTHTPSSLREIVSGAAEQTEKKWERIQMISEMLKTRSGIEKLENFRPVSHDVDELFSTETTSRHHLTVNKDGNLSVEENKVINGSVD